MSSDDDTSDLNSTPGWAQRVISMETRLVLHGVMGGWRAGTPIAEAIEAGLRSLDDGSDLAAPYLELLRVHASPGDEPVDCRLPSADRRRLAELVAALTSDRTRRDIDQIGGRKPSVRYVKVDDGPRDDIFLAGVRALDDDAGPVISDDVASIVVDSTGPDRASPEVDPDGSAETSRASLEIQHLRACPYRSARSAVIHDGQMCLVCGAGSGSLKVRLEEGGEGPVGECAVQGHLASRACDHPVHLARPVGVAIGGHDVRVDLEAVYGSCEEAIVNRRRDGSPPMVIVSADVLRAMAHHGMELRREIGRSRVDGRIEGERLSRLLMFANLGPVVGGDGAPDALGSVIDPVVVGDVAVAGHGRRRSNLDGEARRVLFDYASLLRSDPGAGVTGRIIATAIGGVLAFADGDRSELDHGEVASLRAFVGCGACGLLGHPTGCSCGVSAYFASQGARLARVSVDLLLLEVARMRGVDGGSDISVEMTQAADRELALGAKRDRDAMRESIDELTSERDRMASQISAVMSDLAKMEGDLERCARAHGDAARIYERAGSAGGAAELRRVENLLWALIHGERCSVVLGTGGTSARQSLGQRAWGAVRGMLRDDSVDLLARIADLEARARAHAEMCEVEVDRRVRSGVAAALDLQSRSG